MASGRTSKALILAGVLLPLLGAPSIALALDAESMAKINHIIECAAWLISDPEKHAKFCTPSHVTADQINSVMQPGLVLTGGTTDSCDGGGRAFAPTEEPVSSTPPPSCPE